MKIRAGVALSGGRMVSTSHCPSLLGKNDVQVIQQLLAEMMVRVLFKSGIHLTIKIEMRHG